MTIPARKPRCLRLVVGKRGKNQCESEQVDGSDLCAHHLAEAVREYQAIISAHVIGNPEGATP